MSSSLNYVFVSVVLTLFYHAELLSKNAMSSCDNQPSRHSPSSARISLGGPYSFPAPQATAFLVGAAAILFLPFSFSGWPLYGVEARETLFVVLLSF